MAEPRAGLVETLLLVLDELCTDLVEMDASTAIALNHWPSAQAFVLAWQPHLPSSHAD